MRSTSSGIHGSARLSRAAAGVYAGLAAQAVSVAALAVFEETRGRRLAAQLAAFSGDPDAPEAARLVGAASFFAVLIIAAAAATALAGSAYLSWFRRVRPGVPTPALAAVWLLPGVNLVMPPILADLAWRDAVRTTGRRAARGRGVQRPRWLLLLGCWWLSWLGALGLVFAGPTQPGADLTGIGLPALAAVVVAAILCAATVRELTCLHEDHDDRKKRESRKNHEGREDGRAGVGTHQIGAGRDGGIGGSGEGRTTTRQASPAQDRGDAGAPGPARPPAHHSSYRRAVRTGHRAEGAGPELPELACQSRRWGSSGWRRNRPSRTPEAGPMSE